MSRSWKKLFLALIIATAIGIAVQNISVVATLFAAMLIALWSPIYVKYARDNPKHVWFKRKLFGWGWTPVTWQGWLVIAIYVGLLALFALTIDENSPAREIALTFILPSLFLTILLIRICYRKGEKPKWQWGRDISKYK